MNGPSFTDLSKEAAVAGSIAAGTFELIPQAALIPVDAFADPRWRIVYIAATELRSKISAQIICAESVSDFIAFHELDRDLQRALDSTGTIEWRKWPDFTDTSLAFAPSTRPLEYCLQELYKLHLQRQDDEVYSQGKERIISRQEAIKRLQENESLVHQGNGAFDFTAYDDLRFDISKLHTKPAVVFSLCDQSIATPGNIAAIYAQAKAGKSAVISAMMAAILAEDELQDYLGFTTSHNAEAKAVIHLDTEQSPYDHEQVVIRALRRAQIEAPPSWLRSYCLTGLDIASRREFIGKEMERASKQHSGIFCALIDGVGDFVEDVNEIADTHNFVTELHCLAITYNTVLILVLHENPGAGKGISIEKMRGHLGSQLERKAESNIRIVKESDGSCVIYTEKSRHANISREHGHKFVWDDAKSTHVSGGGNTTYTQYVAADRHFVEEIFNCQEATGGLTWKQLHHRIQELSGLKESGARKRFAKILNYNLIEKNSAGFYLPNLQ